MDEHGRLSRMTLLNPDDICAIETYPRIWVGFSGGLDSLTLLYCLAQIPSLKNRLHAIHVHHGLSANANDWQAFCQRFCQDMSIPLVVEHIKIFASSNIEEQARNARYLVFSQHIQPGELLVLAHHLDDQMETFFLNALRGTGVDGLACMPKRYQKSHYYIMRPFLECSRQLILDFARSKKLSWINDESNQNSRFSRNFLRLEVLPLIEKKWPHYRQSLMHTISVCQEYRDFFHQDIAKEPLDLLALRELSSLERQQYLRNWLRAYQVPLPSRDVLLQIQEQMIFPKRPDSKAMVKWHGFQIRAYQHHLYCIETMLALEDKEWKDFPNSFENLCVLVGDKGILIHPESDKIEVRYRKGGEIFFWKGHHRCLKKCFQEWKTPTFLRDRIPLIYVNGVLKCVVGYAHTEEEGGSFQFQSCIY